MEPSIQIRNLNHYYGSGALQKQILFDITADIYPGEVVINTGPSGSGKTTMLTLVCGLRTVQNGSVRTLGEELNGASATRLVRVRQSIGFIFQAHNLLTALTACQNVQMGLYLNKDVPPRDARERSIEMLKAVGLGERLHHYPHQLSGGQKQRVAIARALVRQPKIILADEPTAALDKASGREVVEILQRIAKEQGGSILLVTHDNRILDIADRILTLEDGRISSFTSGVTANTQQLLGAYTAMQQKEELKRHLAELPDDKFVGVLEEMTSEFEGFLRTLDTANSQATRALLTQVLEATAARIRQTLSAERATVYLVDRVHNLLRSTIADHTGKSPYEISMPIGKGIAGKVAATGQPMNIDEPYSHPDFNPQFDQMNPERLRAGLTQQLFVTKSILCMPIFDRKKTVIGVAQLLNKQGADAFGAQDERRFEEFASSVGIILETCDRLITT
jgi:putative ABC transport system ATP-binding protein